MSLLTDQFFFNALTASEAITEMVGDRIFNPYRPTVDENEDKIPYIVLRFAGLQNSLDTKDSGVEGDEDKVTIEILCVSESCDSLGELTEAVRQQCASYWDAHRDEELTPLDWTFSAEEVGYDQDKPCCYQWLIYQCDTNI